ncbi:MFS transporter [Frankia sp. AgB32]|uniref:MFS transporter n=1 Tax=Frankia sp. AgB32 TaxID=631119 RepID=UPI00200CB8EE|nr:MFS transporter [Frankia sp. AgB32]MCK9895979.1 MFS transporter [Frankia sp. AgB32]
MHTGPAVVVLAGAALIAVLDGTVVAVALDALSGAFDAPLSTVVWVTIAYLLAAAAALPLLGYASARHGGRTVFLAGLGLFGLGSLLCALAGSPATLIAARVVQGFGGGLLEPSAMALAAGLARPEAMGRVLAVLATVVNVAPAAGPLLGGLLLRTGHWQWLFLVNLPLGLAVAAGALVFVPASPRDPAAAPPRADVGGLVLLTGGYVGVLYAVNRAGGHAAGWTPPVAAAAGAVLLAAYVRHALRTRATPALDLRLARRPGFGAGLAVMSLVGLVMYGQVTALPVFAADRYGLHGQTQGVLVCALGVGLLVSMSAGGWASDRVGARPLVLAGGAGVAVTLAVFAATARHLPLAAGLVLFVVAGLALGLTASPTVAALFRPLSPAERPAGTTALFMSVQFAASLSVALLGLFHTHGGAGWVRTLFTVLAAAGAATCLLATRLPGRPA